MWYSMRLVRSLSYALLTSSALGGQEPPAPIEWRTQLILPDGRTPASGVVVEAYRVGADAQTVRAISSSSGHLSLRLATPGLYRLRALRIGFLPTDIGEVEFGAGSVAAPPIVLAGIPVRLDSVRVVSSQVCEARSEAQSESATILAQARVALAASTLAPPEGAVRVHWRGFSVITDREHTPLTPLRVGYYASPSDVPFRSIGAEALLSSGFVRRENGDVVFSAPDAEVLLSEPFVKSHCFTAGTQRPGRSDWVGVEFSPIPARRNKPNALAGSIWLDRRTSELRRVEFRFLGADDLLAGVNAGGSLDFRRLDGGTWMVDRWEVRMPRPVAESLEGSRDPSGRPVIRTLVNTIEIAGAVVDSVTRDDEKLHDGSATSGELLPEVAARVGRPPVCETAAALPPDHVGIVYGQVTGVGGAPRGGQLVEASWLSPSGSRFSRASLRTTREFRADDGFFIFCGVPLGRDVQLMVAGDRDRASLARVRLGAREPSRQVDLIVDP